MTRKDAIKRLSDQLNTWEAYDPDNRDLREAVEMAVEALKEEPRPTGKWVPYLKEGLKWKCSECGSRFTTPFHYCPHCGAKMEGDK